MQRAEYGTLNPYSIDNELKSLEESGKGGKREHLKRRARAVKNSKYDADFLVDYSGNRNKLFKGGELDLKLQGSSCDKSGASTIGKLQESLPSKKTQAKRQQKVASKKEAMANEINVLS